MVIFSIIQKVVVILSKYVCLNTKDHGVGASFIKLRTLDSKGHGLRPKGHGCDQCVTPRGHGFKIVF